MGSKNQYIWNPSTVRNISTIKFKLKLEPTDLTEMNFDNKCGCTVYIPTTLEKK